MEIIVTGNEADAALVVADRFERVLADKGRFGATLGLATGSSPVAAYRELISRHRSGRISFAAVRAFLLDEYIGLPEDHPQSYHHFIREQFTSRIDIPDDRVLSPDGSAPDPSVEAIRYDRAIALSGGVDLQILGIGSNGHIGFNEPASSLASRTRVKTLTESTIADNSRFFDAGEQVPVHVITQGLGTIMEARSLVLTATGEQKARAVRDMVEGPLSAHCPASILQMHPHATVVVDEAAASGLSQLDYYRFIQQQKERLPH